MQQIVQQSVDVSTHAWSLLLRLGDAFITWVATSGFRIVLILGLVWLALVLFRRVAERLRLILAEGAASSERVKRADTLVGVLRMMATILTTVAAAMMVLKEVGIDIAPILATAGIGGLAIGFGAQALVKDVISGFFLLIEDQVRIGDTVEIAGKAGVVEGINLRTIKLRDVNGNLHIIPNGSVTVVTNMTKDYSGYVFDVPIPPSEDPQKVLAALREIGEELRQEADFGKDILEPVKILGIESTGGRLVVRGRITTRPSRQWKIGRELNLRIRKRFLERGIQLQ